ncbi:MAG: 16S rRNA (uracil(1498)-N(3))-methyltransferase [Treponema sp.]|nr:16S rRNA (uracil(1498)-N(3))-methyltransferase [Treponema sp.]
MKQFILNQTPDKNGFIQLKEKDFRYLVRVRRLAVGEYFPALLPDGEEVSVQVVSIDRNILVGKCNLFSTSTPPSSSSAPLRLCESYSFNNSSVELPPIILFQAMPKGDKMDLIVRQAAEGGITQIVPFASEFSIKGNISAQKLTRWQKIIKEARQQSGSKIATIIHQHEQGSIFTFNELLDYWQSLKKVGALGLLFHHPAPNLTSSAHKCLNTGLGAGGLEQNSLHGYLINNPKIAVFCIGPEGGFSQKEVSLFLENGFKPLTIGDTILRTETAALYCAAAIRILLLEKDSWELKKI